MTKVNGYISVGSVAMRIELDKNIENVLAEKYLRRDELLSEYATTDNMAIRKDAYTPKIFRRQNSSFLTFRQ